MVRQAVALELEQTEVVVQLEALLKSFEDIQSSYVLNSRTDYNSLEDIEIAYVLSFHKAGIEVA